jgi:ABC-type Fe3+ transport system permease subunit
VRILESPGTSLGLGFLLAVERMDILLYSLLFILIVIVLEQLNSTS